jgi:lysophospholipase L1-like esterase
LHQALIQGLVFCLYHSLEAMRNKFLYFLEIMALIPVFPVLYFKATKLRNSLVKLPQRSGFLELVSVNAESNLLIIGESTAAGVGATSLETTFASKIYGFTGGRFTILNLGQNGLKAENLQSLFKNSEKAVARSFSKTIILIGANDCFKLTPPRKFRQEIESFIRFLIAEKGVEDITIPMIPPVQDFPGIPKIMRLFLGWHRSILSRELVLLEKKIPHLSFQNQKEKFSVDFFSEDGIHPSDLGYEMIAASIVTKLR